MNGLRKSNLARRLLPAAFLLFLFPGCGGEKAALQEFRETYSDRHAAGDVTGLLELVQMPANNAALSRRLRHALAEEVRWPLFGIAFEPIRSGTGRALADAYALPSIPRWRVHVTLDTEDQFTSVWLAGMTEEGVRLFLPGNDREGFEDKEW